MYKIYKPFNRPFSSVVEIWKDVPEWENCYQVSSLGNVRSKDKARIKIIKGSAVSCWYTGKMLIKKINKGGYEAVHFRDCEHNSYPLIHRLVALAFIRNRDNKPTVNHIDGVKTNNNISNLEWATISEQTNHAYKTGLIKPRGTPTYSPSFKMRVHEYYIQTGCPITELCRVFEINETVAGKMARGEVSRQGLKLTESDVDEIKSLRQLGWTLSSIAEKFKCGISQIHRITQGKSRNVVYERN